MTRLVPSQILGVCRTEHLHPTLISVVAQDGVLPPSEGRPLGSSSGPITARFAYLIDLQVKGRQCTGLRGAPDHVITPGGASQPS